jgi:hypothetical protein
VHRCWKLDLTDARAALAGLSTLDDLLSANVTRRVDSVRHDPRHKDLLLVARLDPADHDGWDGLLHPSSDDYGREQSGAARLTALLASVSHDAAGLSVPPSFVETHLTAAGWAQASIELCIRGQRISSLFAVLSPRLVDVVAECRHWLAGGWLDSATASELRTELSNSASALERSREEVARATSIATGIAFGDVHVLLQRGIADVASMLSAADAASALWIIQD